MGENSGFKSGLLIGAIVVLFGMALDWHHGENRPPQKQNVVGCLTAPAQGDSDD